MGRDRIDLLLEGADATRTFAARLAPSLPPNTLLALYGELGAGKTTFMQGLVQGLGASSSLVQSPTFVYLHSYPTRPPVYHFDLYRLSSPDDFLAMGFEEFFEKGGITAIEWPERIATILPPTALSIHFTAPSPDTRRLILSPPFPKTDMLDIQS
jgi:tRNA threonylcarbamoyladenosine biosynthesis protein TsaE